MATHDDLMDALDLMLEQAASCQPDAQGYLTDEQVDHLTDLAEAAGEVTANADFDEERHPRAPDGRFGAGGAAERAGVAGAHAVAHGLEAAEHVVVKAAMGLATAAVKRVMGDKDPGATPGKMAEMAGKAGKLAVAAGKVLLSGAFVAFKAGNAMAEKVAKERGYSEDQAKKLAHTLSVIDNKTFEVCKVGALVGVHAMHLPAYISASIPVASTAYIAYSTARNPAATARAATKAVERYDAHKTVAGSSDAFAGFMDKTHNACWEPAINVTDDPFKDHADAIADALEDHDYADWYVALLMAALDKVKDVPSAIALANKAHDAEPEEVPNVD